MHEVMMFWRTCHKLFEMDEPSSVDTSLAEMWMKELHVQSPDPMRHLGKGFLSFGFQFHDKMVTINIVPRHKSTDRKDML